MLEQDLDRLSGTRLQLETQVNTLESAIFNQETMAAMKMGADVLKAVHGNLCVVFRYAVYHHTNHLLSTSRSELRTR